MDTLFEQNPERKREQTDVSGKEIALTAIQAAFEKKATDIVVMEVREVSGIADYFILCCGDAQRQVKAIADGIRGEVRDELGENPWRSEGYKQQEWILLDYVDVVVHVMTPEKRAFYGLERLWNDAPKEDVPNETHTIALLAE